MQTVTTHLSRRRRPFRASAILVTVVSAACTATPVGTPATKPAQAWSAKHSYTRAELTQPADTRAIRISYRSYTGARRPAIVLVPRAYKPGDPRSRSSSPPHSGRAASPARRMHTAGATCRDRSLRGRQPRGPGYSPRAVLLGSQGQIADLARMPDIVSARIPWLRIDRQRIYASGAAWADRRHCCWRPSIRPCWPGLLAIDSLVDFRRQYLQLSPAHVQFSLREGVGPADRPRDAGTRTDGGRRDTRDGESHSSSQRVAR